MGALKKSEARRALAKQHYRDLKNAVEEKRRKDSMLADAGVGNAIEVSSLRRLLTKYRRELYFAKTGIVLTKEEEVRQARPFMGACLADDGGSTFSGSALDAAAAAGGGGSEFGAGSDEGAASVKKAAEKLTDLQKSLILERARTKLVDMSRKEEYLRQYPEFESATIETLRLQAKDLYQQMQSVSKVDGGDSGGTTNTLVAPNADKNPSMVVSLPRPKFGTKSTVDTLKLYVDTDDLVRLKKGLV